MAVFVGRTRAKRNNRTPGTLFGTRRPRIERHCGNENPRNHQNAHHLLPLWFSGNTNTATRWIIAWMPKTPEQLFAALDALGIFHSTVKHPPLFTVEQSRNLRGQIPGGHTKNLFLRDKKYDIYLVVALEDADVDLKGLHRRLGATGRFSFGSADLLREVLGVEPGAVTPFGAINDAEGRVTVVLDTSMMEHET
ncbi:MAG: YbaK/EbsC family protein, partial [Pseudolabrys sp.]